MKDVIDLEVRIAKVTPVTSKTEWYITTDILKYMAPFVSNNL